jgi:hypothetical protein
MKVFTNKRGQGGDTFKLLIAAVIAMVILGIVTGVFQNIWDMVGNITCVSSPINEMVTKIQKAQAGIVTSTDAICMNAGERFMDTALTGKVTNLASVTFACEDAAVCNKDTSPISATNNMIEAKSNAKFKALIGCTKQSGASGNYDCTITINNA